MRKESCLVILWAILFCIPVHAIVYTPSDDTYIDEYTPNQGDINGTKEYLLLRNMNLSGWELDTLVMFDLSSIPIAATVESARLHFYYYLYSDSDPTGNPIKAHRITSAWSESTTSWNTRPVYDPTETDTVSMPASYGWMQWDVTGDVQDFIDGTETNYGWQIMNATASGNSMIRFYPKEYADSDYHPYLELKFKTIYVDAAAAGANDGSSWTDAYTAVYGALDKPATSGDRIWVARGTYKPDTSGLGDPRQATFQLIDGVAIYGGFAGGETDLNQRDWKSNVTVLSGDIGVSQDASDNCYNVVTNIGTGPYTVLNGFTVTGGNADSSPLYYTGGGMYSSNSTMAVANCIFTLNSAISHGGGLFNSNGDITVNNCTFIQNSSDGNGGGVCNVSVCEPEFVDCIFNGNYANGSGGGMGNRNGGSPTLVNCLFSGNYANYRGGGISNYGNDEDDCCATLINCTIVANSAYDRGGGLYTGNDIGNCHPTATNCIFWANTDSSGIPERAQVWDTGDIVTYSTIQDDCPHDSYIPFGGLANNNFDDDPMFVRYPDDNSDGWTVGYDDYGDLRLNAGSPSINVGNGAAIPAGITTDLDGNTRFFDAVDQGAYERSGPYCGDTSYRYPIGDMDYDCRVTLTDFALLSANWMVDNNP